MPAADQRRTLFLAQLPPPVHGVTVVSKRVLERFVASAPGAVEKLWSGGAASLSDINRRSPAKALGLALLLARLAGRWVRRTRYSVSYTTLAPWTHAALRDCLLAAIGRRLADRSLVHLHGEGLETLIGGTGLTSRLARALLRGSELIAITGPAADTALRSGLFCRVHRLPNCVDDPGPPDFARVGPVRCGFLGNLDPRKGAVRLIETADRLRQLTPPPHFTAVGASTAMLDAARLRDMVSAHGLEQTVRIEDPLYGADKSRFLAGLDVFVYLSRHDHAPLVLLEALAHGLAPIVIDTGGVAEMLGPELAGNVIASGLADSEVSARAAQIIATYVHDPDLLAHDRRAARGRYLSAFTPDRFAAAVDRLLSP